MGTVKNQNMPDEFIFAFQTALSFWGISRFITTTTTDTTTAFQTALSFWGIINPLPALT
jgi:hypothetical protein